MVHVRTILKIPLNDQKHELHVVRPKTGAVMLSVVNVGGDWAVRNRITVKLPRDNAIRLGKFLCDADLIDGVTTESMKREIVDE